MVQEVALQEGNEPATGGAPNGLAPSKMLAMNAPRLPALGSPDEGGGAVEVWGGVEGGGGWGRQEGGGVEQNGFQPVVFKSNSGLRGCAPSPDTGARHPMRNSKY